LNDPSRNDFIHTLDEMLHKVGTNNGAVMEWRQVLFSMQNYMSAALANQADRSRVEKLLQQGQALVGKLPNGPRRTSGCWLNDEPSTSPSASANH